MKKTNMKLLTAIRESGMTQRELADKIGVADSRVSSWVRGATPHKKFRVAINEVLDREVFGE